MPAALITVLVHDRGLGRVARQVMGLRSARRGGEGAGTPAVKRATIIEWQVHFQSSDIL